MTSTGLVVIPFGLLLLLLPWRYSFPSLLVMATFNNAAVVNVGAFGLQPGFFFGMLVIARTAAEALLVRPPLDARVLTSMLPLIAFFVISIVSLWVGLSFFQGRITVMGSLAGFDLDLARPYKLQRQNFTQLFYLVLNMAIAYCVAHQVGRLSAEDLAWVAKCAIPTAIVFASLVAFWEMAHFYAGVFYPSAFFNSNVGYYGGEAQVVAGLLRVSGPFSEPAALAYQLSAYLMFAWYRFLRRPGATSSCLVILCLVVMAVSTSTTAYAALGIFALVAIKDMLLVIRKAAEGRATLTSGHLVALIILGAAALGADAYVERNWRTVDAVLTSALMEKRYTTSFAGRAGADLMAIDIAVKTGGIGLGLGSHRANNLAMTILSNSGIVGLVAFGAFAVAILHPQRARRGSLKLSPDEIRPLRWFVIGLLIVHAISNPNLSPVILWVGFGLVMGAVTAVRTADTCEFPSRGSNVAGVRPRRGPGQKGCLA